MVAVAAQMVGRRPSLRAVPCRAAVDILVARGSAVALWAAAPALAAQALSLPPFLLLAVAFAVAFLTALGLQLRAGAGARLAPPAGLALGALPALLAAPLLWLLVLRIVVATGDPALPWPILAVLTDSLARPSGLAADLIAAGLALGGAVCWVRIGPALRRGGAPVGRQFGWLCGIAAAVALLLHLCLEPRLAAPAGALLAAAALGAGPFGAGMWLWSASAGCRAVSAAPQPAAAGR